MPGLSISISAPPTLRRRFELAAGGDPLDGLSAGHAEELDAILRAVDDFDDLPGKWQAALVRAEAAVAGTPAPSSGSCCGGGALPS